MIDTPDPPPGRRSRLEDEVLEILTRSDRQPTMGVRVQSDVRRRHGQFGQLISSRGRFFSAPFESGIWLVGCIALAIIAFVLRDISPFGSRILAIACFTVIMWAIVRSFGRHSRNNVKQWRGRDINVSPTSRSLWIDWMMRNRRPPKPPIR